MGLPTGPLAESVIAGLLASLACGLGVVPLIIPGLDPKRHTGIGYGVAGGLMVSASVYNLILPGLNMQDASWTLPMVLPVVVGILLGSGFLSMSDRYMGDHHWQNRTGTLIFLAMCVHSIPEGVAVGVGYTSGEVHDTNLGSYIALAIALHNIPEGLAVAIPMRSSGASISRCFWAAVLTSLPQPLAAIPAVLISWFFQPIMPLLMGFAAGAMIFLVVLELIPEALETDTPRRIAWAFTVGFCAMLLVQVLL